jgi:hypothetical protein
MWHPSGGSIEIDARLIHYAASTTKMLSAWATLAPPERLTTAGLAEQMQKIKLLAAALIAALCLGASTVHARPDASQSPGPGWVLAFTRPDSTHWVHLPSRVRRGNIVGVWRIDNWPGRRESFLGRASNDTSALSFTEYNCNLRQFVTIQHDTYFEIHARNDNFMRSSDVIDGVWRPISPGHVQEIVLDIACRR